MFNKFLLSILFINSLAFNAQQWQWAQKAGYASAKQQPGNLCVDSSGNVYASGVNSGTTAYYSGVLNSGPVLIKYDHLGNEIWARSLNFVPQRMACDHQSNVYMSGFYQDSVSTDNNKFFSKGSTDMLLVKLNSNGQEVWARSYGAHSSDAISDIAVEGGGDVYLTGSSIGDTLLFHNYSDVDTSRYGHFFLAKISAAGNTDWVDKGKRDTVGHHYWMGFELNIDKNNQIYVLGTGGICKTGLQCGRHFLAKYNAAGQRTYNNWRWPSPYSPISELELDDSLNVYIHFGDGGNHPGMGWLHKYDANLNLMWTKNLGAQYGCWGLWMPRVSRSGKVYLSGIASDFFGHGTGCTAPGKDTVYVYGNTVTLNGSADIFVLKLDNGGKSMWLKTAGGNGVEYLTASFLDRNDNLHVTSFYNVSNTSPTSNTPTYFDAHFLQNDGNWQQMAVAKLADPINFVSINENSRERINVTVFPNPSSGKFKIAGLTQKAAIKVFDAIGQQIHHQTLPSDESTIDLSAQAKGIYIITFQDSKLQSLKVIKE